MLYALQQGQFGRGGAGSIDLVSMDFEGSNGGTTFTDTGSGRSSWSAVGSAALSNVSPAPLAGLTSLKIPSLTADAIKAAYGANNCLPAKGDWNILFRVRCTDWVLGGTGKTFLSAQNNTASAAGTAFAIASNSSGQWAAILSDGTTRSVIATTSGSVANNTTYDGIVQRRGNTVSIGFGAGTGGSGTFSGAINLPAGQDLRIGQSAFGNFGASTLYLDSLRIRVYQ